MTVSEGVGAALAELVPALAPKIVPIYNPAIDPARVLPRRPRVPGAPPMVLAVGRLAPQKNYPLLLAAFALLRREMAARLVILGEGPDRAALEAEARRLGIAADLAMPVTQTRTVFETMTALSLRRLEDAQVADAREGAPGETLPEGSWIAARL